MIRSVHLVPIRSLRLSSALSTLSLSDSFRSFHRSESLPNTINQTGIARLAGPTRTQKYMSKRMQDKMKEEEAAAKAGRTFETNELFIEQVNKVRVK